MNDLLKQQPSCSTTGFLEPLASAPKRMRHLGPLIFSITLLALAGRAHADNLFKGTSLADTSATASINATSSDVPAAAPSSVVGAADPRQVAIAFAKAIQAGDDKTACSLISGRAVPTFTALWVASEKTVKAAGRLQAVGSRQFTTQWDGTAIPINPSDLCSLLISVAQSGTLQINGEKATITPSDGQKSEIVSFTEIGGDWKMVVPDSIDINPVTAMTPELFIKLANIYNRLADNIESGRYKTISDYKNDLPGATSSHAESAPPPAEPTQTPSPALSQTATLSYPNITYKEISFPESNSTVPQAISGNTIAGAYSKNGGNGHAFLYDGSTYKEIYPPQSSFTYVNGVSGNLVVGSFLWKSYQCSYYYDGKDYKTLKWFSAAGIVGKTMYGTFTDVTKAPVTTVGALFDGVNGTILPLPPGFGSMHVIGLLGDKVVGNYINEKTGLQSGFIYENGVYTNPDPPDAYTTTLLCVSKNNIVGVYQKKEDGIGYFFLYNGTTYNELDFSGIAGISGTNVVGKTEINSVMHGRIYDGSKYLNFDPPGSVNTEPTAIDGNNIVGFYVDNNQVTHGFLANVSILSASSPSPETSSLIPLPGATTSVPIPTPIENDPAEQNSPLTPILQGKLPSDSPRASLDTPQAQPVAPPQTPSLSDSHAPSHTVIDILKKSPRFVGTAPQVGERAWQVQAELDWDEADKKVKGWIYFPQLKSKKQWEGEITKGDSGKTFLQMKETAVLYQDPGSNAILGVTYRLIPVEGGFRGVWAGGIYHGTISITPLGK